ncbi:MAG: SLC13 family permease [Actinomycetota bacterium]
MSPMAVTFLILGFTIVMFVWGKLNPDFVAMSSAVALYLFGIITLDETFAGFASSTVIMIAALFIVGEGLTRTGVTDWASSLIVDRAGSSLTRMLVVSMIGTAVLSAFISNTGTVATLMPAIMAAAWLVGSTPSKLLIPIAFAANAGGLLTLTGTPPNIVVAEALIDAGLRPFGYFEYALIGLPLLIAATVYMAIWGRRLLPTQPEADKPPSGPEEYAALIKAFAVDRALYAIEFPEGHDAFGMTFRDLDIGRRFGVVPVYVRNRPEDPILNVMGHELPDPRARTRFPFPSEQLKERDVLVVRGIPRTIDRMVEAMGGRASAIEMTELELNQTRLPAEIGWSELMITPRSKLRGKKVREGEWLGWGSVQIMGIRRPGEKTGSRIALKSGDTILVRGRWPNIHRLRNERTDFVVVGHPEAAEHSVTGPSTKAPLAVAILVGMVVLMVTGVVPAVMATLLAAGAMLLTGAVNARQAYRAVSWSSVVLIAAMFPTAIALTKTGGTDLIAGWLVDLVTGSDPRLLVAAIYLVTVILSQVLSNTATTIIIAPVVLSIAFTMDLDPHALLITVSVAASTAFLTPIGTTTNVMVMAPGHYKFTDYTKVGLPLVAIFFVGTVILAPLIWSL